MNTTTDIRNTETENTVTYSVHHGGELRGLGRYAGPGLTLDEAENQARRCRQTCGGAPTIDAD